MCWDAAAPLDYFNLAFLLYVMYVNITLCLPVMFIIVFTLGTSIKLNLDKNTKKHIETYD